MWFLRLYKSHNKEYKLNDIARSHSQEFIIVNTMPLNSCVKLCAAEGNNNFKIGMSREDNLPVPQTALMLQFGRIVSNMWGTCRKRILQG
jgi:hypothetical protein